MQWAFNSYSAPRADFLQNVLIYVHRKCLNFILAAEAEVESRKQLIVIVVCDTHTHKTTKNQLFTTLTDP